MKSQRIISTRAFTHIGLRTIKTGIAVALALLIVNFRGSPAPIFAAIGAISAMSRALADAVKTCLTQFAGIIAGAIIGCIFIALFPQYSLLFVGAGIILVITCCNALRMDFAISLACIVFISIILQEPGSNYLLSALNRLIDTSIGLFTAFAINMLVRPYNNRKKIVNMMTHIQQTYPGLLYERIVCGHFPDLSLLGSKMEALVIELNVFEKQPPRGIRHPREKRRERAEDTAYLRGCMQLLWKMFVELNSLCEMDETPTPSCVLCERLKAMGLVVPPAEHAVDCTEQCVMDYHVTHLLDANDFLTDLNRLP